MKTLMCARKHQCVHKKTLMYTRKHQCAQEKHQCAQENINVRNKSMHVHAKIELFLCLNCNICKGVGRARGTKFLKINWIKNVNVRLTIFDPNSLEVNQVKLVNVTLTLVDPCDLKVQ